MESWFFFALLSFVFSGLYSFFLKVSAEKNHDSSQVSFYTYLSGAFLAGIFFFLHLDFGFSSFLFIFFLAFLNAFLYFLATLTRIESLRCIHTTLYFPLYKTFGPLLVTVVSLFFFKESLSSSEIFGIVLGIFVPLLLINKKESSRQSNLKKGLFLLFLGMLLATIASSTGKIIMENNLNFYLYIFLTPLFGLCFSLFTFKKMGEKKFTPKKMLNSLECLMVFSIF